MSVAEQLAPIELASGDGGRLRIGSLWSERPLLLTFLRHFG